MIYIFIAVLSMLWVGCGVLSWGFYQGSHRNACYKWLPPRIFSEVLVALSGPVNLAANLQVYGARHWSWKPISREERWEAHQREYAILNLTYENFDK